LHDRVFPLGDPPGRHVVAGETAVYTVFWQGFQLFMAFELVPQALLSLMKPFGTLLLQINAVPAKGQATYARSPAYWR
jgi:hypothetical protein